MGKRRRSASDESSSSSEEDTKVKQEASDSSSSSDDDGEWNAKPKKGKKKAKTGKKPKESKLKDEEREEGEVEDDESDLDDDLEDEFNDGYDENLMGDEADKERLAKMTEKEREQELFNRGEKREVLRTRFEIEKKLRLQKKREQQKQNMKDFSESTLRSNERRRNMEDKRKQKDTLKTLKEQREKKKQKQQKLRASDIYSSSDSDDDDKGRKAKSSSSSSSSSSSGDSSDDSDNEAKRKKDRRKGDDDYDARDSDDDARNDNFIITLADIKQIRMSRTKIEKWCHAPFFNSTSVGCFVKVGLGVRMTDMTSQYRLCQVVEVTEGPKIYPVNPPQNTVRTNKIFKLRHGKEEKNFRLEYISNRDIEANEFSQWVERMEKDGQDMPTRSQFENKKKDLANAASYQFSDSDIDLMLKEKEKFDKTPKNYAMKKTYLLKMKQKAEEEGDTLEVSRIMEELDSLEDRAKEIDKQRTHSIAGISYINERNRLRNIADTERAILEARAENEKKGLTEEDDPFRRRTCRPTLVHKFNKNKNSMTPNGVQVKAQPSDQAEVKTEPDSATLPPTNSVDVKPVVNIPIKIEKAPASPPAADKNDLFSAHDFDIQIDFEIPPAVALTPSALSQAARSTPAAKEGPQRRTLNLEDYKKKKGLI